VKPLVKGGQASGRAGFIGIRAPTTWSGAHGPIPMKPIPSRALHSLTTNKLNVINIYIYIYSCDTRFVPPGYPLGITRGK
jgi:hypothetical protein